MRPQDLKDAASTKGGAGKSIGAKKRKRNRSKQYTKYTEMEEKPYTKGKNDPAWRTSDETLTKLSASLAFGIPAGLTQHPVMPDGYSVNFTQPGILSVFTNVTIGSSADYNSPMNLAFRKIYSYVRHANSGSRNYEAADMGLYFSAVGQCLALLGWAQRVLRLATEYSSTNRYLPLAMLKSMGVDADDVTGNLAQLKYCVSWFGKVMGSLAFPDIPYFHACYEAFKYVYRDNDSVKEQFYLLTPYSIGKYVPTYNSNGGGVVFKGNTQGTFIIHDVKMPDAAQLLNYTDIFAIIKERTDVLLGDEDIGIIAGDILKAFGDKLFKVAAFDVDYDVLQHSPEFLQQIHNLNIIPDNALVLEAYSQQPGSANTAPYITSDLVVPSGAPNLGAYHICDALTIDAFSREPDYKEVVNCTVLNPQVVIETNDGTNYHMKASSAAFDLFMPVRTFIMNSATGAYIQLRSELCRCGTALTVNNFSYSEATLTNFDWHPLVFSIDPVDNKTLHCLGDLQNMRIFDYETGVRIHECSMLNLLAFNEHNFY